MRKIIATEFVTVDGVMESPHDWSVPFRSDEAGKFKQDELFAVDALLLGRVTYEGFAAAWPSQLTMKAMPTGSTACPNMSCLHLTVGRMVQHPDHQQRCRRRSRQAQRRAGQDILIFGSAELVDSLADQGLIDEYRLMTFPVVVGSGKRVFQRGTIEAHARSQQNDHAAEWSHRGLIPPCRRKRLRNCAALVPACKGVEP